MIILELTLQNKGYGPTQRSGYNKDFSNDTPQPVIGFLLFILEDRPVNP